MLDHETHGRKTRGARVASVPSAALGACLAACSPTNEGTKPATPSTTDGICELSDAATAPNYLKRLGCTSDFNALASDPMDDSIPGARSGKVVLDRYNANELYFQNSKVYPIHYEFALANLQGSGLLHIASKQEFDGTQYTAPDASRRFLLGAVTYYEQPRVWALELAPYDTATSGMIAQLLRAVKAATFFGSELVFHPTSEALAEVAKSKDFASDIPVKTTDDLFAATDYQPLNLGQTVAHLKILKASQLTAASVGARDLVVLDEVPNDITVVAGLVTEQFQTPLSHVNVLAQNRGTPNMGLRNATTHPKLLALDTTKAGQTAIWTRLTVGAFSWSAEPISNEDEEIWWEANQPKPVKLPELDFSVKDLRDITTVTAHTDSPPYVTRADITQAIRAFGAKAANYSVLSTDPKIPHKTAFAIPVYYYDQFMRENGFYDLVQAYRSDPSFVNDASVREAKLNDLIKQVQTAPVNDELKTALKAKLDHDFAGHSMRYRSSTNAEDLDGFPCAGCYDSHTGDPAKANGDQLAAALDAIRKTWATAWKFRTYEERDYHSIDHTKVAMALLVHTNFPDEEANGVATTVNPYDATGNSPGLYVNVQKGGDYEVVAPPPGITSDSFIYQIDYQNQPVIYLTHSNVVATGETVLSDTQIHDLGVALQAIDTRFVNAYRPDPSTWNGMDVEFKFDDEDDPGNAKLYIKQARPYPGRGK